MEKRAHLDALQADTAAAAAAIEAEIAELEKVKLEALATIGRGAPEAVKVVSKPKKKARPKDMRKMGWAARQADRLPRDFSIDDAKRIFGKRRANISIAQLARRKAIQVVTPGHYRRVA
jgi:hypothetical protein